MSNHLKILNLVYSHEFLFPFSIIFYEKCHGRLEDLALYKYFLFLSMFMDNITDVLDQRERLWIAQSNFWVAACLLLASPRHKNSTWFPWRKKIAVIFNNWFIRQRAFIEIWSTREVWRARKMRESCSRRSREQPLLLKCFPNFPIPKKCFYNIFNPMENFFPRGICLLTSQ